MAYVQRSRTLCHLYMAAVAIFVGFLLLGISDGASGYCAHLEFPDLPDLMLTAPEDSVLKINFKLVKNTVTSSTNTTTTNNNKNDNDNDCLKRDTTIIVSKSGRETQSTHHDYCILLITADGHCHTFSERRCRCLDRDEVPGERDGDGNGDGDGDGEGGPMLLFTKRMVKEDGGWWWWWTRDHVTPKAKLLFSVSARNMSGNDDGEEKATTTTTLTYTTDTTTTTTTINNNSNDDHTDNHTFIHGFDDNTTNTVEKERAEREDGSGEGEEEDGGEKGEGDAGEPAGERRGSRIPSDDDGVGIDDDSDHNDDPAKAEMVSGSSVDVPYFGAAIVCANIFTIVIVVVVVVVAYRLMRRRRGRRQHFPAPLPCKINPLMTDTLRRQMEVPVHYSSNEPKRSSPSSSVYDEIPADTCNSIYLTPTLSLVSPSSTTK